MGLGVVATRSDENVRLSFMKLRKCFFYIADRQQELQELALDLSHKTSTKFEFHKENF